MATRWLSRKPKNHHSRAVVLVDSKVVLGAATKGRSSAGALRSVLRSLAATLLASDVLLRLVYIPTESNPADAPSRGVRKRRHPPPWRRSVKKLTKKPRLTRTERWMQALPARISELEKSGLWYMFYFCMHDKPPTLCLAVSGAAPAGRVI